MNNEQELIAGIRGGDHEAFGILVTPLLSSEYKSAYLILRSKEHAEDALQNALEGAFVKFHFLRDHPIKICLLTSSRLFVILRTIKYWYL